MTPEDRSTLLDRPLGGGPDDVDVATPTAAPDRRGWIVAAVAVVALLALLWWQRDGGSGASVLRASEPMLDFGTLGVGEEKQLDIDLTNVGDRPVKLQRIEVAGNHADDFVLRDDACTGRQLTGEPSGEAGCRLSLTFRPPPAGDGDGAALDREGRTAALRVLSDAANGPVVIPLVGGRELPRLVPSHRSQDFGRRAAGDRAPPVVLTFENQGAVALALGRVRLEGEGALDFLRVLDSCSEARLGPGESCTVRVAYTPRSPGDSRARLLVPSAALFRPLAVTLAGYLEAPELEAATDDSEPAGSTAGGEATTGRAPETIVSDEAAAGRDLPAVETDPVETRPAEILPADATVAENPPAASSPTQPPESAPVAQPAASAQPSDSSTAEVPAEPVPLAEIVERRVVEVAPPSPKRSRLLVEPTRLDFGRVVGDRRVTAAVTVMNEGNAPLTLGGLRLDAADPGSGFRLTEGEGRPCRRGGVLAPGARCTVTIAFTAADRPPANDSPGEPRSGRLVVEHDGSPSPDDAVPLTALALPVPMPRLALSPARLSFAEQPVGRRSAIEVLTLRNAGSARLELKHLRIEGPAAADFRLVPATCDGASYVAPGGDCTVGVRFSPSAAGFRRARLVVESSARPGAAVVELGGSGLAAGR